MDADSILERIRRGCRDVADRALLVRLDQDRAAAYASTLVDDLAPAAPTDPWSVPPGDAASAEQTAGLVLSLAAINFGSGYHPFVHKRPGCSGAVTMATAWREHAAGTPPTPADLAGFTARAAHEVFGQPDDGGPLTELMDRFARALRDLGRLVIDEHGGSFVALVGAAGGSAARLVETLDALAYFHDVATYRGTPVPLYKRAQLAAADLDRAFPAGFDGDGPLFVDLDRLTAFADNLVPHVLRVDGVLRYDPALAASIDAGQPLAPGSDAEVEIRAVGVHAVEVLRAALAAQGIETTSSHLDAILWSRGGAPRYKAVPRHRTRSTAY